MRLIDADELEYHTQLECMGNGQYEDVKVVYECDIYNAPTIDAEPVVRCKECDSYIEDYFWYDDEGEKHNCHYCTYHDNEVQDNDYCSYGERREP